MRMEIVSRAEEAARPQRVAVRRDATERRMRRLSTALCLVAIAICGCGYAGTPPGQSGTPVESGSAFAITVSPSTASVPSGGAQVFTASVSGTTNIGVTWSVNGIAGGNSTIGTIASTGAGA